VQQTRYRQLRDAFEEQNQPNQDTLRQLHSKLFDGFARPLSDTDLNALVGRIEQQNGHLTRLRFRHWQQVRALFNPSQQARFDQFLNRLK